MNQDPMEQKLRRALRRHEGLLVLEIADHYLADEESRTWGLIVRGLAYEFGGGGLAQDLERAELNYRQAVVDAERWDVPYVHLARALAKQGNSRRAEALRYLDLAFDLYPSSELELAYGDFHAAGEGADDMRLARRHYWRAAGYGRFKGFFGYSRICRKEGRWLRALAVDALRLLLAPWMVLVYGRRASGR